MRLTLRALLNWMDGNLLPEDAASIAQQVEESEVAKTLKASIEGVLAVVQLPAPLVLDGTPQGNANSSAEYLDNVSSPETTPEFEKFCLNSAVVLGEIAACHKILSIIMTEETVDDVPIDMVLRMQGLYDIHNAEEKAFSGSTLESLVADGTLHASVETESGEKNDPENDPEEEADDEYEYVPSRAPWIICTVLLALLCLFLLLRKNGGDAVTNAPPEPVIPTQEAAIPEAATPEVATPEAATPEAATPEAATPEAATPEAATPEAATPEAATPEAATPEAATPDVPDTPPAPTSPQEPTEKLEEPAEELDELDELDEEGAEEETDEIPDTLGVGIQASPEQLLLLQDSKTKSEWELISEKDEIHLDASYVSLPGFQPSIDFMNELQVTFKGSSKLSVQKAKEGRPVELLLRYGKFVFQTLGKGEAPKSVSIAVAGYENLRILILPETLLAVDVYLDDETDADPAIAPKLLMDIYLFDGGIELHDANGMLKKYESKDAVTFRLDSSRKETPTAKPITESPVWVIKKYDIPRKDSVSLQQVVSTGYAAGKTILTCLRELEGDKNKNIRTLANRCLIQLGDPIAIGDYVKKVGDSANKRKRQDRIEFRAAIYRSPQHAQAIKKQLGEKNKELYQSLLEK